MGRTWTGAGRSWAILGAVLAAGCTRPEISVPDDPSDPVDPSDPTDPTDPVPEPSGPLPSVVINELMPGNASTLEYSGAPGLRPDWIELLNTGRKPVALADLVLRSSDGDRWTGPADGDVTEIAPGERVIVWASDELGDEPMATGFNLEKDGDKITLLDGYDRVVDFVDFDALESDIAWARTPDETGAFAATAWASPSALNPEAVSPTLDVASETVFVPYVMHQIQFTFTADAFNRISDPSRPEVHVAVDIDGITYDDIGLKLKGSASYQTMDGKPAFIADFNNWVAGTKFRGLKALKLHNGVVLDPTRSRDHLSYGLARAAGIPAPRTGWAEVYCNGEYYGLYILVEKHDDAFIEFNHPGERDLGVVLEPNEAQGGGWGWGDFGQGNVTNWNYEEGPIPPDPLATNALIQSDEIIARAATDANVLELWQYFDQELHLKYMAWETLIMHTDGYRAPNNWRVFVDGVDYKVSLLPAGAEWTWDFDVDTFNSNGRASSWCLSNAMCKRLYAEKVVEMADLVEELDLHQEFNDLQAWLDPYIQSDPRYTGAWDTVGGARQSTNQHLLDNPGRARDQVRALYPDLVP